MAEDSDLEKTEPATPRRLDKAREEGQVARSRELATFMILATGMAVLWLGGTLMYEQLSGVVRRAMAFDPRIVRDTHVMLAQAGSGAWDGLLAVLPVFALLAVVAVLASILLGGLVFSAKALQPQFGRMNVLKGMARMVSMHMLVELGKTLAKAGLVGGIAAMTLWHFHDDLLSLMHAAPSAALGAAIKVVAGCVAIIVASLMLIVLIDAPWQMFSHAKKLRMTKQQVREENKESEGDPHVKGRIRQQQRAMARRRMMSEVPKADVVVTNPTHYAVALRYEEAAATAPVVIAKGTGLVALRIREMASEHKVPLLEAAPLARALHQHVEIGQEIPAVLYAAVAEVLAWVFQLRAWNPVAGAPQPECPQDLQVPQDMDPQNGIRRPTRINRGTGNTSLAKGIR